MGRYDVLSAHCPACGGMLIYTKRYEFMCTMCTRTFDEDELEDLNEPQSADTEVQAKHTSGFAGSRDGERCSHVNGGKG